MLVSFDPHSASPQPTVEVNSSDASLSASSRGIADFPSTITSYGSSTVGFFSWLEEKLGELWNSIKACFCPAEVTVPSEVTVREVPWREWFDKGNEIINNHFNRFDGSSFLKRDAQKSAIIVIIKCNGQFLQPIFSKVSTGKHSIKDTVKANLGTVLYNDSRRGQNFLLEIDTFFIEKNHDLFMIDRNKESLKLSENGFLRRQNDDSVADVQSEFVSEQLKDAMAQMPDSFPFSFSKRKVFDLVLK